MGGLSPSPYRQCYVVGSRRASVYVIFGLENFARGFLDPCYRTLTDMRDSVVVGNRTASGERFVKGMLRAFSSSVSFLNATFFAHCIGLAFFWWMTKTRIRIDTIIHLQLQDLQSSTSISTE